jgi:fructose-1,6-bisphosphatase
VPLDSQVCEEPFYLRGPKQGEMPETLVRLVKADVLCDPAKRAPFGAIRVMFEPESLTHLFEQFHGSAAAGVRRLLYLEDKRRNTQPR